MNGSGSSTKFLGFALADVTLTIVAIVVLGLAFFYRPPSTLSGEKISTDTQGLLMITKGGETAWVVFVSKGGRAQPVKASICMSVEKCKDLVDSLLKTAHVKVLEVDEPADENGSPPTAPEAHPKGKEAPDQI